jgi:hypothetical protein
MVASRTATVLIALAAIVDLLGKRQLQQPFKRKRVESCNCDVNGPYPNIV